MSGIHQLLLAGGLRHFDILLAINTGEYNLFTAVGSPIDPVEVVLRVGTGVYVTSSDVAIPAFDVGDGWAAGSRLKLINDGFILAKGGVGASWGGDTLVAPEEGGVGFMLRDNILVEIDNLNGAVAGGGGGGGGIHVSEFGTAFIAGGGGGAGGGDGGRSRIVGFTGDQEGGAGGDPGGVGFTGQFSSPPDAASGGGGGGRITPGTGGAGATPGAGGGGGSSGGGGGGACGTGAGASYTGGVGGNDDDSGGNGGIVGPSTTVAGGGGGGWGAFGGNPANLGTIVASFNGVAGGPYAKLNGFGANLVWLNDGIRLGSVEV